MTRISRNTLLLALLALLVYSVLFQGMRGLWESSEGRYVNVALQMIETGDWLHPQTHHEHPHWTKPPATYWAIASALELFGHAELALRVPGILAFVLTTLLVYLLGRLFHPQRPWLPALIYATFLFPATASNVITTDNLLTFAEALAMTGFAYAYWGAPGGFGARYGALFGWFGAGLGFLIKGPAVGLPLFALLVFHLLRRKRFPGIRLHWIIGSVIAVLVGGSWFLMLAGDDPDLFVNFIWNEVLLRATTGKHHRNSSWYGGLQIYLPILLIGSLPWLLQAARGLWLAGRNAWRSLRARLPMDDRELFLLLWFLLPLLVFMVARSRLPLYVLPLFVPLALLAANQAEGLLQRRHWYLLPLSGVLLVLAVRVIGGQVDNHRDSRQLAAELRQLWPHQVDEVVFVDTEGQQGLHFYLGAEVEDISLEKTDREFAPDEDVAEELADQARDGEQLWLIRTGGAGRFEQRLRSLNAGFEVLGDVHGVRDYRVYRVNQPGPADSQAPGGD